MQKNIYHFSFLSVIFICIFLFTATTVYSASIKDRMVARIPTINSLNENMYLVVRSLKHNNDKIVS